MDFEAKKSIPCKLINSEIYRTIRISKIKKRVWEWRIVASILSFLWLLRVIFWFNISIQRRRIFLYLLEGNSNWVLFPR